MSLLSISPYRRFFLQTFSVEKPHIEDSVEYSTQTSPSLLENPYAQQQTSQLSQTSQPQLPRESDKPNKEQGTRKLGKQEPRRREIKQIDVENEFNKDIVLFPEIREEYKFNRMIARTAFSKVYLVNTKDSDNIYDKSTQYVIKVIEKNRKLRLYETDILSKLKHNNIVDMTQYYDKKHMQIIVMPFYDTDLYTLVKSNRILKDITISDYTSQIANGLYYCHLNNIIHRDIKMENILVQMDKKDGIIKICDFGLATNRKTSNRVCGTHECMAPEMLHEYEYDYKVDLWALGIVLFQLYYFVSPFASRNKNDMIDNILYSRLKIPVDTQYPVPKTAKHLMQKLLKKNPSIRLDYKGLLKHPFLTPGSIY